MFGITKEKDRIKIVYSALFILLLFAVVQYGSGRIYGPILFPDEIGYWGTAATMKGYDWSEITSLGSYYSYGYGMLLYPILSLDCTPVQMYRIALFINFLLLSVSFLLLYRILKKIGTNKEDKILLLFSMGGILYSSWIFFMQVTLSEILLMTLYLLIVYLFLTYQEKARMSTAFLLSGTFVYLYFVHMRTIGIVIAGIITFLLLAIFQPKYRKSIMVVMIAGVICFLAGLCLKEFMVTHLYLTMEQSGMDVNSYGGQWHKFLKLLTLEGMWELIVSAIGKLFYLGISTFGLFYFGMAFLVTKGIQIVKHRFSENVIPFFILLSVLGQFAVSAVYMSGGGYVDNVLYGRYNEIFLPIVMCLGMVELLDSKKIVWKTLLLIVVQGAFALIIADYCKRFELAYRHSCFIVGVNYATNRWNFNLDSFLIIVLLAGTSLYLLIMVLFLLMKRKKECYWLLSICMLLQLLIGFQASNDYIYTHNAYNYSDIMLGQELKEAADLGKEIYYSKSEESAEYIGLLQYSLQENTIHVMPDGEENEYLKQDNIVITYKTNEQLELFRNYYQKEAESTHFYVFYNK